MEKVTKIQSGVSAEISELPVLPLRDVVVYPHMVVPLFVGRDKSLSALEEAMAGDKQILLAAQRRAKTDDPNEEDIFSIGTVFAKLPSRLVVPTGVTRRVTASWFRVRPWFSPRRTFDVNRSSVTTRNTSPSAASGLGGIVI